MSSTIRIEGRFTESMTTRVKTLLQAIPQDETEVVFIINSHGGSHNALEKIKGYMYFMKKYRKCKIIGQLEYGESAGLLCFLNCDERQVTDESIGIIHLPISKKTRQPLDKSEKVVIKVISFIKRRVNNKLSEEEIIKLENVRLNADRMKDLGIATKKVTSFSSIMAESV